MANKKQTEKEISVILKMYDKKHLGRLLKSKKFIDELYNSIAREATRIGISTGFNDSEKPFSFDDYPMAKKRVDAVISEFAEQMQVEIEQGSKDAWLISAQKNAAMIDALAKGTKVSKETMQAWKKPNMDAFEAFQQRKVKGMGLSDRVWRLADQTKSELELALDIGLGEGKSAADLSRDVRKYLNEPNKLFRRVRDKHGNLHLSKNAQAYHPGQGVYRSSYKNAIRLTATENNMAYYSADNEHWGRLDFVIGKRIQLSNNHTLNGKPFHDVCDELAGDYPKDFKFTSWHPLCRCVMTPILADWDEQLKVMKMQKDGEDVSGYHYKGEVKEMPKQFNQWIEKNSDRIARAKSMPYFIKDNFVGGDINAGLNWQPNQRMSIQERAKIRHEARTQDDIDSIQRKWNMRLLENNGESYQVERMERFINKYAVDRAEWDAFLTKPMKYDKRLMEFPGLEKIVEKYEDLSDINANKAAMKRGELFQSILEANKLGAKGKAYGAKIQRHILQIDKREDVVAYWLSDKEDVQIANAKRKIAEMKAHREEVRKAWQERRKNNNDFMPSQLAAKGKYLEGEDYEFDKDFFGMLKVKPKFEWNETGEGGSYEHADGHLVHIEGKTRLHRCATQRKKVIYHEFGHAIVDQRGLFEDPDLLAMRDRQTKWLKKKDPKLYKWDEQYSYVTHRYEVVRVPCKNRADYINYRLEALNTKLRRMKPEILARYGINYHDAQESICALADTLKSLVPSYGYGHSDSYFRQVAWANGHKVNDYYKIHEYMAHAFENKFGGNPIFKKIMPDIHDEMVAYIEQVMLDMRDFRPTWK